MNNKSSRPARWALKLRVLVIKAIRAIVTEVVVMWMVQQLPELLRLLSDACR